MSSWWSSKIKRDDYKWQLYFLQKRFCPVLKGPFLNKAAPRKLNIRSFEVADIRVVEYLISRLRQKLIWLNVMW